MVYIGICEDDPLQMNFIKGVVKSWLEEHELEYQLTTSSSSDDFLNYDIYYDIIFLDVELGRRKELDGIGVGQTIRIKNKHAKIIYITGHEKYREKALDVHCFNFLLKPISEKKVIQQLKEALEYMEGSQFDIVLKTEDGFIKIKENDVYYFEYYQNKKIRAITRQKTYIIHDTLIHLENSLSSSHFFRSHNAFLVNLSHVNKFHANQVELSNAHFVPLSGRTIKSFKDAFYTYLHAGVRD